MDFAVSVKGVHEEGKAGWVLVVDRDDSGGGFVLMAHDDNTLHWHPLEDCKLEKVATPSSPRPVYLVEQAPVSPIVTPIENRVQRRQNGG